MEERRESATNNGLSGLEKTFNEYKSKLEAAEKEAEQITSRAWRDAEEIIKKKQVEAQQTVENIKENAKKEAEDIIQASRNRAYDIEKEANEKAGKEAESVILSAKNRAYDIEKEAHDKAKREAKDKLKREIEKLEREIDGNRTTAEKEAAGLVERARREAEAIANKAQEAARIKAMEESKAILMEATTKAHEIDEDSIARAEEADALILQLCQKSEAIYDLLKAKIKTDLADLSVKLNRMRDKVEVNSTLEEYKVGIKENEKTGVNASLTGRRELNIMPPYDRVQVRQLREALKQIPSLRINGESGTEEKFSFNLVIDEPVPLLGILEGLSLVESSQTRGNAIELKLKPVASADRELIYSP